MAVEERKKRCPVYLRQLQLPHATCPSPRRKGKRVLPSARFCLRTNLRRAWGPASSRAASKGRTRDRTRPILQLCHALWVTPHRRASWPSRSLPKSVSARHVPCFSTKASAIRRATLVPLRSCTQSPMLAMRKSVVSSFGLSSSSRPAAMPRSSKHVCPVGHVAEFIVQALACIRSLRVTSQSSRLSLLNTTSGRIHDEGRRGSDSRRCYQTGFRIWRRCYGDGRHGGLWCCRLTVPVVRGAKVSEQQSQCCCRADEPRPRDRSAAPQLARSFDRSSFDSRVVDHLIHGTVRFFFG